VSGRLASWNRFVAWVALSGLVFQILASAEHSAAHLDHLLGQLGGSVQARVGAELTQQSTDRPCTPAAPHEKHCPLDLGLIVSGTFIAPGPSPGLVLPIVAVAPLDAVEPVFLLTSPRHLLPLARAPPVIEMPV
jgi:hypothetical protein